MVVLRRMWGGASPGRYASCASRRRALSARSSTRFATRSTGRARSFERASSLSAFSSASLSETVLYTTTSLSSSSHTENLGGSDAWLNNLTLARTPDWWHATLRTNQDSSASWPGPYAPAQATVATTPTYPLYPGEQFELQIYNYQTYASNVASLGFTVAYDTSVVSYSAAISTCDKAQ